MMATPKSLKERAELIYFPVLEKLWKAEVEKIKPDIIVCDFFTRVGVYIGDDLGIPVVINIPGLMGFLDQFGFSGIVNF